jgi:transcriptional regulator with XRE-family HTH domain
MGEGKDKAECKTLLVKLRELGWTRKKLAGAIDMGEPNLCSALRGTRALPRSRRKQIAEVLGCSEQGLFPEFPVPNQVGEQICTFLPNLLPLILECPDLAATIGIEFQITEGQAWWGLNGFIPSANSRHGYIAFPELGLLRPVHVKKIAFVKASEKAKISYRWV